MTGWWPQVRAGHLVGYLDEGEYARLLAATASASVAAGDSILKKGSPSRSVLLVEEGEVEIVDASLPDGTVLAVVGPGGVFGEVGFLDGRPRTHDVRARTACRLRRLTRDALLKLVENDPTLFAKITIALAELIADRFRDAVAEMEPIRAFAAALDEPMDLQDEDPGFEEIEEPLPESAMADLINRVAHRTKKGLAGV